MNKKSNTRRGFTLIELLVVVLIVGILAAVAVPQYQKAVQRSQYANVKNLVKAIANAQEVYYLANGTYSDDLSALDVEIPDNTVDVVYDETNEQDILKNKMTRSYQWGKCSSGSSGQTLCRYRFPTFSVQYQIVGPHSEASYKETSYAGKIICVAEGTTDSNSPQAKFCQTETGKTSEDLKSTTWLMYFYN